MSKKELAVILSGIKGFNNPKVRLEQYITPSEAAATILWDAHLRGLIKDKFVVDACAGTGLLGIGALLLGASKVLFIEEDPDAVFILEENLKSLDLLDKASIVIGKVEDNYFRADLVLMNPPFGTKQKHVDAVLLKSLFGRSNNIYSFHKSVTKDYLLELINSNDYFLVEEFPFTFSLAPTMSHHRKKQHLTRVSAFYFKKKD